MFEDFTVPRSSAAIRLESDWKRTRALLDELRALRAPRLMIFADSMNVIEGAKELPAKGYEDIAAHGEEALRQRRAWFFPHAVLRAIEDFPAFRHIRSYWYDAVVSQDHSTHAVQELLHQGVRDTFYCELVLGRHPGRREEKRQKGVDVRLAVDMVQHAHLGNYDCAALVGGDEDFVPAVQAVKASGRQVICCTFTWQLASDGVLADTVDRVVDLAEALRALYPELVEEERKRRERDTGA